MFELYERYRLKTGEVGRAVDILGRGEACIFEFEGKHWRTVLIPYSGRMSFKENDGMMNKNKKKDISENG